MRYYEGSTCPHLPGSEFEIVEETFYLLVEREITISVLEDEPTLDHLQRIEEDIHCH
jgi:hypothetical protein